MKLKKSLLWTLWALSIFGWFSVVTECLNTPSTPIVVLGVFIAVIATWSVVKTAQVFWRWM